MKRFLSIFVLSFVAFDAVAAQSGRPAMSNKIMAAPRYTASINQLNGAMAPSTNVTNTTDVTNDTTDAHVTVFSDEREIVTTPQIDMREAERNACINNNIGIGNTFVWASRYSNTNNYSGMVEDVVNPQNNVCFVRVELKSDDESRVSVADIAPRYFMWGENIECGSWANKKDLEQRILDAKKGNRIAGIVASSVGGAAVGVGAMELFGNRLIGGKLEGQKNMEGLTLYKSQLLTLKSKNPSLYEARIADLRQIKRFCEENPGVVKDSDGKDACGMYADLLAQVDK